MSADIYRSVFDILQTQNRQRPDAIAIEDSSDIAISYAQLFDKVQGLIKALLACGIERGSRVAIVLPNGPDLAVSLLGATCVATSVPLNPAYRKEEYSAYFSEIGVDFLLTRRRFHSEARAVAEERGIPVVELSDDGRLGL